MKLFLDYAKIDPITATNMVCFNSDLNEWATFYDIDEDTFCLVIESIFKEDEVNESLMFSLFKPYMAH